MLAAGAGDSRTLKLVNPADDRRARAMPAPRVAFGLEDGDLVARFDVAWPHGPSVNPALAGPGPHWGLWSWDVVELFVRASSSPTYHEFQVSPLGQYFELEIHEPRKNVNREFRSGLRYSSQAGSGAGGDLGWRAEMRIPLARLGWGGERGRIVGNAFAILAMEGGLRSYWSLFSPRQDTPDFHQPDHFESLLA